MNNHPSGFSVGRMRPDHRLIMDFIPVGSSVLDLGCGDGELLNLLIREKDVYGSGIEIDEVAVRKCASRGLSVSQQDIECGLSDYGDKSFDFVILNQSLQQVVKLEWVLKETLRVGRWAIIGFPNFAYYKARLQMLFSGHTPVTPSLPNMWYDTPNLHFLSISDFITYLNKNNIMIEKARYLDNSRTVNFRPNLCAQIAILLIKTA